MGSALQAKRYVGRYGKVYQVICLSFAVGVASTVLQ